VRQNSFPLAQRTKEAHMKTRELLFAKKKKKKHLNVQCMKNKIETDRRYAHAISNNPGRHESITKGQVFINESHRSVQKCMLK